MDVNDFDIIISKAYGELAQGITQEIFIFFDRKGIIQECNVTGRRKLGYSQNEIVGKYIGEILTDVFSIDENGDVEFPENDFDNTVSGVMYRKNMTCFDVKARIRAIVSEDNIYTAAVSAIEISLQKSAEKQMTIAKEEQKKTEQVRTEFVANVTHELRTPLNGIIGHVKDLKATGLNSEQLESIRIIEHCSDNMMKLINNILDFSKLEAGKYLLDEQECEFSKFVDNIVATHIKNIDEKGLRLIVNMDKDIPEYLICDELALTRILNNLLSNAVKFTSVGNVMLQITKSSESEEYVELFFAVIDSGIGISDEEKTKLFKEFSQVDASVTRKYGGTGLGLSITKQLVELMSGKIYVESTKGQGSTFSFNVFLKKSEKTGHVNENNFTFADMASYEVGHIVEVAELTLVNEFGSSANISEIHKNMEKLAITIELNNFEKAENFASNIKELVSGQNEELDRHLFKFILTLRKSNYDKAIEMLKVTKEKLAELTGEEFR